MKSIQILIVIALAVTLYIFLRFIVKRIWLFTVLRRFAKKHGYACRIPLSGLLPNNRSNQLVLIETGSTLYAVKLFGLLRKHCEIHFWSTQEYSIEWYFSRHGLVGSTPIGLTNANRRRSLGSKDRDSVSEKEVVPVLLISPAHAPVRLSRTQENQLVRLHAGDKIGDVLFADLDFLFRYIENREK